MFVGVPRERVADWWQEIEPFIAEAVEGRGYESHDIFKSLFAGEMNLCLFDTETGVEAVCVSEVLQRPHFDVWRILITTGRNRQNWQHHIETVAERARAIGCKRMEILARPGWERVLKDYGWKKTHVLLEKDLSDA